MTVKREKGGSKGEIRLIYSDSTEPNLGNAPHD